MKVVGYNNDTFAREVVTGEVVDTFFDSDIRCAYFLVKRDRDGSFKVIDSELCKEVSDEQD